MVEQVRSRSHETAQRLQAAIAAGRWPIDTAIPSETELAAEFGVGRSTVREAVRSLAHVGMLEPAPGRGTYVRALSPVRLILTEFAAEHDWRDILQVRTALEAQAARVAAAGRDPEVAERLAAALGEPAATGDDGCSRAPGQFHATLVEAAGNRLLTELHSSLISALRAGIASGQVRHGLDPARRQEDHAALLAVVRAGHPEAAAQLAARHAADDLVVHPSDDEPT